MNSPLDAILAVHPSRRGRLRALLFALALVVLSAPSARSQEADSLQTRAAGAMQAADWSTAATLYAELVEAEPENGAAWYRLGLATVRSGGDTEAARRALERAGELGFPPPAVQLGIAASYAVDGDAGAAIGILESLAAQGPSSFVVSQLETDASFELLRSQARYDELVIRLTPCASDEYRQFDFWLGTWEVVSPQGQALGANTITASLDGCMLIESWESASGGQKGMRQKLSLAI